MNLEIELEKVGFTKNESKVFIALLKIGETTTTDIIKKTGINTSKVYESLERLLKKGMASYTLIQNKKYWKGENPLKIKEFLDQEKNKIIEKEKIVDSMLEELTSITNRENNVKSQYRVFEGLNGVKTARENVLETLEKGDTFYVILSNYKNSKTLDKYWVNFQERRVEKGIKCRYILNENLRENFLKDRTSLKLTQTRFVTPKHLSPMWIEIYKNKVGIGILNENPSVFVIENKEIAQGFKDQFEILWNLGKK